MADEAYRIIRAESEGLDGERSGAYLFLFSFFLSVSELNFLEKAAPLFPGSGLNPVLFRVTTQLQVYKYTWSLC